MKRVVVTGLGLVTPLGCGVNHSWDNLLSGISGVKKITKFDPINHKCKVACEVPLGSAIDGKFNPEEWIEKKEIKKVDLDSSKQQYISIFSKPRKPSENENDFKPTLLLSEKNNIYFNTISRDRKKLDICVADLNTGKVKVLINNKTNTYFYETKPVYLIKNESEIIHWSEEDGWGHYYLSLIHI